MNEEKGSIISAIAIVFLALTLVPGVVSFSGSGGGYSVRGIMGKGTGAGANSGYNVSFGLFSQPVGEGSGSGYVVKLGFYYLFQSPPEVVFIVLNATDSPLNRTTANLTGYWVYYDPDGDSQQLFETRWYKNTIENSALANTTVVTSGNTTKGEVWEFAVRVFDGSDWSGWYNSSLLILNSPPTQGTPILNATTQHGYVSDDLYCWNQSTSDADGDVVINVYQWFRNSVEQPQLENTTVVTSGNTSRSDVWYCRVTPYDNETAGIALNSNTLYIRPLVVGGLLIVKFTVPGNSNIVYVPGEGERSAASDGQWEDLPEWYISSNAGDVLYGLVRYLGTPAWVSQSYTPENHTISIAANISGSRIFLVNTEGDWRKINERMPLIRGREFLGKIAPTFGFGLGLTYPIKIFLDYSALVLENSAVLGEGQHYLIVKGRERGVRVERA